MAAVAQVLGVLQAAVASREAQEGSLGAAESGAWSVQTTGAQRAVHHVELLQLGMKQEPHHVSLHRTVGVPTATHPRGALPFHLGNAASRNNSPAFVPWYFLNKRTYTKALTKYDCDTLHTQ